VTSDLSEDAQARIEYTNDVFEHWIDNRDLLGTWTLYLTSCRTLLQYHGFRKVQGYSAQFYLRHVDAVSYYTMNQCNLKQWNSLVQRSKSQWKWWSLFKYTLTVCVQCMLSIIDRASFGTYITLLMKDAMFTLWAIAISKWDRTYRLCRYCQIYMAGHVYKWYIWE
jgi:hypothetical protein